jgi:Transglycosylase SLT domain
MAAIDRANANFDVLFTAADANGIPWQWLAAIAIEESQFQNINQRGGKGVGVFQIDLGRNPGVTAAQAQDLAFAADWAAKYLATNYNALQKRGLSGNTLLDATFDSYNAGLGGVTRVLTRGGFPDNASYNGQYGGTALNLTKCF